jgi:hypothetical protein
MALMTQAHELQDMNEAQLREYVAQLLGTVQRTAAEIKHKSALIDKLTYENAMLRRLKFAAKSEALHAEQRDLLNEALDADLEAVSIEIEQLMPPERRTATAQPKRLALPAQLPREEFRHEPEVTECCGQPMKRMGEDVS